MKLTKTTVDYLKKQRIYNIYRIQEKVISIVKKGKDMMHTAKAGSGKTLAFLIPAMEMLIRIDFQRCGIIIITPTRELALQIYDIAKDLLFLTYKKCVIIIGGEYRKKVEKK